MMNILGIARIVLVVRDIEKAADLFENKYNMEIKRLSPDVAATIGAKMFFCPQCNLEVSSPILPLSENASDDLKNTVKILENQESIIVALGLKVENAAQAAKEAEEKCIRIIDNFETKDFSSLGIEHLVQYNLNQEDTLGITMAFVQQD